LKRYTLLLILLTCIVSVSNKPVPYKNYTIKKIVIDPGHGGGDSGCLGSSCQEKNIALNISLKFGKMIEDNFKDIKVIYTRTTDKFVELKERAEIANRENADLFICIHCNSAPGDAYGIETYAMGLDKSEANLAVAKRENASILLEDDYKKNYNGFNPNSPESDIAFSLYQNAFLDQSISLAAKIQHEVKAAGRYDRGVKQARFLVLWRTTMPSILVETGFLTNRTEEAYMKTDEGQNIIATALFKGFKSYKNEVEGGTSIKNHPKEYKVIKDTIPQPKLIVKDSIPAPVKVVKPDTASQKKPIKKGKNPPVKGIKNDNPPAKSEIKKDSIPPKQEIKQEVITPPKKDSVIIPKEEIKEVVVAPKDTVIKETPPPPKPVEEVKPVPPKEVAKTIDENDTYFAVQIAILPTPTPVTSSKFSNAENVRMEKWSENTYKYLVGHETDINKATSLQTTMRGKGFKDAFVVAYSNGKRITVGEALNILKKKN
jgi:N-acetylmuramoyl-L-alanine amidase